ncbi:MAG: hypothetical protein CVU56_11185 [Deltaproteobacteria bacterium HGW-Deltaproteobacteria-14]|jgi:hypothetical protein|nr:MAG: hypothetical protein CVU56_11185 [Deltaproteobacteria bacterium HGW-Deltaproteobacteria-14]
MRPRLAAVALALAVPAAACGGARGVADGGAAASAPAGDDSVPLASAGAVPGVTSAPTPIPATPGAAPGQGAAMTTPANASTSPDGEPHPGAIVHDDKVDGRVWTRLASEVPSGIGWVRVGDSWRPVVRIEITGTPAQRRMTKFGADGAMLESTVQAPPRPQPQPTPQPTPLPEPQP